MHSSPAEIPCDCQVRVRWGG